MSNTEIVLAQTRKKQGLTQEDLASLSGLHVKTIEKWEQQKVKFLNREIISTFCRVLKCSIEGVVIYKEDLEDSDNIRNFNE